MNIKKQLRRVTASFLAAAMLAVSFGSVTADAFNFTPVKVEKDENDNYIKLELRSESVYMLNMDTGEVLIDIDSTKQRVPASLTKIMTAIVLLDEFGGDESKLKSTKYSAGTEAFDDIYGTGASTADIYPDEEVTCYDLLAALMIPSACEAANIIAFGMCGSVDAFADKMNAKAAELGMTDSHFSNAHGLSGDNNYTTCQDLAKACTYAIETYPVFKDIVCMNDYTMSATSVHPDGTYIYNTNYMLNPDSAYFYSYCRGIKTGTLDLAGRCLASYSVNDGSRYLIISMGAPLNKLDEDYQKGYDNPGSVYAYDTVYYNLVDHINLYQWAYSYVSSRQIVNKNSEVGEAKIEYGENGRDYVTLKPEEDFSIELPVYVEDKEIERSIEIFDNVIAPVKKGDKLGEITISYENEEVAKIPLIATDTVERSKPAERIAVAKSFKHSTQFKAALFTVIMFTVIFVTAHIVKMQRRYMKRMQRPAPEQTRRRGE
ncbi:D-alanyl-D-alanine carboxypeptidase (penicillin-binding protein 5/6) [Ruminococcus sp. YE71]|uniref:D-alanyl-D-alanine carboxypeptidase family protein n=1 Tax=unclassified Ruminococcus TaxID=2608920 RepID=UPI000890F94A|nr:MULTISPECIES: D-alanyl-D-alanine carboxypeptidase family protein [unclassified Ruminococcus]SDA23724.1 D-alanyl-D-alanine carboxypeptidase (penicillin-binding protein 5/6) [Ruminococcus sp. YE78]SFW40373.1 D-alanyl-D-alanine carboxypeptidase (penicillin-binding protein 5/6) [Ruminococcus sp. YE71]